MAKVLIFLDRIYTFYYNEEDVRNSREFYGIILGELRRRGLNKCTGIALI